MVVQDLEHDKLRNYFRMAHQPYLGLSEHQQDIINFSTSSPHRLPTISVSQALQNAADRSKRLPTGLSQLDLVLGSSGADIVSHGIPRGQVTEVYGPPGVGKTSFALQVVVNAASSIEADNRVFWVSAGSPVISSRITDFASSHNPSIGQNSSSSPPTPQPDTNVLDRISFSQARTLAHLLTLFLHPTAQFPPPQTAIIVVDDLSNLLLGSFPRTTHKSSTTAPVGIRERLLQRAAGRRWAILADLASAMSRMAISRNVAILVVNQTGTSFKPGHKVMLKPALSGQAWEQAVRNRILLYRDFASRSIRNRLPDVVARRLRFAKVLKVNGMEIERRARTVMFVIRSSGLQQINLGKSRRRAPQPQSSPVNSIESTRPVPIEIADSEDEDGVGLLEDDMPLPTQHDADAEMLLDLEEHRNREPLYDGLDPDIEPELPRTRGAPLPAIDAADDDDCDEPMTSSGNERDME